MLLQLCQWLGPVSTLVEQTTLVPANQSGFAAALDGVDLYPLHLSMLTSCPDELSGLACTLIQYGHGRNLGEEI